MRWDVFCAVVGMCNCALWLLVAHLISRRIDALEGDIRSLKSSSNSLREAALLTLQGLREVAAQSESVAPK